jgi:uncharacterized protein YkwD
MLGILLVLILRITATESPNTEAFALAFMQQVNEVRTSGCMCEGKVMPPVGKVTWHPKLEISATLHAQQMVRYRFFEHYSKGGMDIGQRVTAVGYPWRTIGENLGRGQISIPEVIRDWKKSPSHCRLLMNPKFREMGAAHAGNYWVLHMGVRKES